MARRIVIAIICLLLGTGSTLAVSWACAAWLPYEFDSVEAVSEEVGLVEWQNTFVQKRFGLTYVNHLRGPITPNIEQGSLRWHTDEWQAAGRGRIQQSFSDELRAGWPFRAFRCTRPDRFNLKVKGHFGVMLGRWQASDVERGIALSPHTGGRATSWRALPYDPIWPGLLGNITIHVIVWWFILLAPIVFIRWHRLRRNCCPKCSYPIGVSPICTECGHSLPTACAEDQADGK